MARRKKLWAGRIGESTALSVEAFTSSIAVDRRLYRHDIAGSIAHARMLARQRIITAAEAKKIVRGLELIEKEITRGNAPFSPADEDIHMNIERRLVHKIGPVGGKLHTARSRNDQVALDMRLFLRDELEAIGKSMAGLKLEIARTAKRNLGVIMPGYTHLQRAQPVLFSHHLLAYAEMLERDQARLEGCAQRVNVLPLGSGALAGTSFPIDRAYVARLLGFSRIARNSIDAVSDRDFILEFLALSAVLFVHLSRLAEELVLWSSEEFGFIELPDGYCTGSSMMPQKKNPDVPELIRGRSGRIFGHLQALLTVMKGLPLAYNRDLQEDKIPLFDTVDTVKGSLEILRELMGRIKVNRKRMLAAAEGGYMNATDLADYLVRRGLSFRVAHGLVGRVVRHCLDTGRRIEQLSLKELKAFCPKIEKDVFGYLAPEAMIERRSAIGGTASSNVRRRLREMGV
ncbi:MAG TPA: argininosuccinate lyase [Candidatus Binatia bacterium]